MLPVRTIETDPTSPFGDAEVPPAEWTFRFVAREAFARGPEFTKAWLAQCGADRLPKFPAAASLERTVTAYVNHGRWLWDCPICKAAQCCTPNDPRAFCVGCFNRGDGYWPVLFPDAQVIADATVLLERRARVEEQNWNPAGESIDQLQLENLSIGVDPNTATDTLCGPGTLELVRSIRGDNLALDAGTV